MNKTDKTEEPISKLRKPEDAPVPRKGVLTFKEEEKLTRLRQERHDTEREARELLLTVRASGPADYRVSIEFKESQPFPQDMTEREWEGVALLTKPDFVRWCEIHERGFEIVKAQHELIAAAWRRVRANLEFEDS